MSTLIALAQIMTPGIGCLLSRCHAEPLCALAHSPSDASTVGATAITSSACS
jgi:hypothetical protein